LTGSLESSRLGGRGGAGFPASIKVALGTSGRPGGTVVVNGMESEPASDKDKLLLTRTPHLVLDGAQFVAALSRAARIVVCVPSGHHAVSTAVSRAIAERVTMRYGRITEDVAHPPDRFVAGEESSLVNWLDTERARPIFRLEKGTPLQIGNRPALVHNCETLAHIALIARYGPEPFLARGLPSDPGTFLVTISGAVARPGVVEVDRGTPLWDIARRSAPTEATQALLVGGYGGSWVGPAHFSAPYSTTSLREIGATAGVGVLVVLGTSACGLAETARITSYLAEQSAGQCGPCTFGLPAIADDMSRLARARVDPDLMARLERRLHQVQGRGACRHPDGAVGLARSALTVFIDDLRAHVRGEPCVHVTQPSSLRFPIAP
jgi:NADH:ubiquinone oxidoreductase subunit F (NADH-binding)